MRDITLMTNWEHNGIRYDRQLPLRLHVSGTVSHLKWSMMDLEYGVSQNYYGRRRPQGKKIHMIHIIDIWLIADCDFTDPQW